MKNLITILFFTFSLNAVGWTQPHQDKNKMQKEVKIDFLMPKVSVVVHRLLEDEFKSIIKSGNFTPDHSLSQDLSEVYVGANGQVLERRNWLFVDHLFLQYSTLEEFQLCRKLTTIGPSNSYPNSVRVSTHYNTESTEQIIENYNPVPIPGMESEKHIVLKVGNRFIVVDKMFGTSFAFDDLGYLRNLSDFDEMLAGDGATAPEDAIESKSEIKTLLMNGFRSSVTVVGQKEYEKHLSNPGIKLIEENTDQDYYYYLLPDGKWMWVDGLTLDEGTLYVIFNSEAEFRKYKAGDALKWKENSTGGPFKTIYHYSFFENKKWSFQPGQASKELTSLLNLDPAVLDYSKKSLEKLDAIVKDYFITDYFLTSVFPHIAVYVGEVVDRNSEGVLSFEWNGQYQVYFPAFRYPGLERPQHYAQILWKELNNQNWGEVFCSSAMLFSVEIMAKIRKK